MTRRGSGAYVPEGAQYRAFQIAADEVGEIEDVLKLLEMRMGFEAEMAETRLRADLDHVEGEARADFGAEAATLPPPADASEEALAALETETAELAASIERLGPVNVLAFEEHKQETERLTFLTTQLATLE